MGQEIIYNGPSVRIDKYLAEGIENHTRTQIQQLIDSENILVNNKVIKANYKLKDNDIILINFPEPVITKIIPQDIPLNIVYEDRDLIVVNKPAGMVVHPAPGNKENTLVNALLYHCKDLSSINGIIRAGIVHRIDKDTSGLLVACKNDISHKFLSKQFADRKVTRKYIAICSGVIPHNYGKIDAPIGRDPNNRQQMTVITGGKNAVTNFKVLERFNNHTLVELELETGRTHQIRVHLKYIGYPVSGDPIYGLKKEEDVHGQFLHAKTLGFIHPQTKEFLGFDSELPDYFELHIKTLRDK